MTLYRPEIGQRGLFQWIKASPEDGRRREMWRRMFGSPEVVRPEAPESRRLPARREAAPWAPAPATWPPSAAAIPASMYGRGNQAHDGIWWGLAIPLLFVGGFLMSELSGLTNITGPRRTA